MNSIQIAFNSIYGMMGANQLTPGDISKIHHLEPIGNAKRQLEYLFSHAEFKRLNLVTSDMKYSVHSSIMDDIDEIEEEVDIITDLCEGQITQYRNEYHQMFTDDRNYYQFGVDKETDTYRIIDGGFTIRVLKGELYNILESHDVDKRDYKGII